MGFFGKKFGRVSGQFRPLPPTAGPIRPQNRTPHQKKPPASFDDKSIRPVFGRFAAVLGKHIFARLFKKTRFR